MILKNNKIIHKINIYPLLLFTISVCGLIGLFSGCGPGGFEGYSNTWLHPEDVSTVYVEMFDSTSFRRGHEYVLTDAVCKLIESATPYKIVSDRDYADTILSGNISGISSGILASERYTGRTLENETIVRVSVSWKNLKTGELMINNEQIVANSSYSSQLGQDFEYSAKIALNRAANKVIELMEETW